PARPGPDGRIRTSFKQCKNDFERPGTGGGGTVSGRLAVGRWQAQAIPHLPLIPEGAFPVRKLIGQVNVGDMVVRYDGTRERTNVRRIQYEHDLAAGDRKSTRLNSSHVKISYAVFCLKKKNITGILDN